MFLRSLTLSGFKSFAEATTLTLEPGITVVVGPNGSGKSNVVDAIAWVLGAQGPSALRGQRMDDVIFAGTDRMSALGRAQVTLVIDNESGTLPTQTAEVAITRTLFRSGESEYALNGTPCRLLDLQELLNDAGVGRQQHIIVAQGQITGVLAARPEERRALIEEAAGVLKFRRRKERAERRLEGTEANVVRLVDLQRELRRQLRPLERQAEAARRHRELSAELAGLRLYNAGRELADHERALGTSDARRAELAGEIKTQTGLIDEADGEVDEAQAQLAGLTTEPTDRLSRVASLSERARGLLGQTYERLRSVQRERNVLLDSDVVATLADEHARLESELAELDAEEPAEASHDGPAVEPGERSSDIDDIEATPTGTQQLQAELHDAQEAHERAQSVLSDAAAKLAEAQELHRNSAEELQHHRGRLEALASAVATARTDSGIETLEDLDSLETAEGVAGVLGDLVRFSDGAGAAVEAAADGALGDIVVRDERTAAAVLAALARNGSRGSVISLGLADRGTSNDTSHDTSPGTSPGTSQGETAGSRRGAGADAGESVRGLIGLAPEAPGWCREALEAVLDELFADVELIRGDWPVALEQSAAHPGKVFVTEAGDRFGPRRWQLRRTGPLTAATELEAVRARIAELSQAERDAAAAQDTARQAHSTAVADVRRCEQLTEQIRRKLAADEAQRQAAQLALEDLQASRRKRRLELSERLGAVSERLAGHERARASVSAHRERSETIVAGLDRLALRLTERRGRLEEEAKRLRIRHEARAELVSQLTERLNALRRERDSAANRLEALRSDLSGIDVEDAERRTKRDSLIEMLAEEFSATPQEAVATTPPTLDDDTTPQAHEQALRRELDRLGPVNPLALAEFEEASERHAFVESQLSDVRNSRRELHKVIRAIDAEIVATFADAYEDVARNFAELFATLFPGGSGTLRLTDPSELLTSGVELDVRPAGKRVGRLSLLSGGERALVALAYLFAVFRSRPSPFYVLDEVEAALDDVNLQRFLDLVAEFRRESQLLIVSHQRRTMESADVLYGVSMPPGGASVVVSERAEPAGGPASGEPVGSEPVSSEIGAHR